jgi:hypothetical protein
MSGMRGSVWFKDEDDAAKRQAKADEKQSEKARLVALEESMQAAKTRVLFSQKKGAGKVKIKSHPGVKGSDVPYTVGIPELLEDLKRLNIGPMLGKRKGLAASIDPLGAKLYMPVIEPFFEDINAVFKFFAGYSGSF